MSRQARWSGTVVVLAWLAWANSLAAQAQEAAPTLATYQRWVTALAFSPDESILYIADTGASHDPQNGPRHIRACEVAANGTTLGRSDGRSGSGVSLALPAGL